MLKGNVLKIMYKSFRDKNANLLLCTFPSQVFYSPLLRKPYQRQVAVSDLSTCAGRDGLHATRHTRTSTRRTPTSLQPYIENISCGANREMCGDEYHDATWDRKSKDDAVALLASLATFDFVVSFLVLYEFLSHLPGVTVKLQGQSIDIIKAYLGVGILNGTLMSEKEIKRY